MLLRQLVSTVAQQLLCACITADVRMHNSCCACDDQLLCANYYPDLCPLCLFVTEKKINARFLAKKTAPILREQDAAY